MGPYKCEAILLAVRDYDDASRMVTLFSREYGKLAAVAYGARRPRSELSGCTQAFAHVDLVLAAGKGIDSIKQCAIRRSFRELREDLDKMAYSALLSELVTELWPEREPEPEAFDLLLAAFSLLGSRNARLTALAAALQLLSLAGFRPELESCVVCGRPLAFPARFDAAAGGGVCEGCGEPHLAPFSAEGKAFFARLLALDFTVPGSFSVTGAALMETERLLGEFLTWRLDKPLKSLAFIAAVAGDKNAGGRGQ
ncbi:MAG TPA: DNA repair protein RecO [Negativicutes bacterium]|nr:DNA repair protein RecO [Negativicutes bacterium]